MYEYKDHEILNSVFTSLNDHSMYGVRWKEWDGTRPYQDTSLDYTLIHFLSLSFYLSLVCVCETSRPFKQEVYELREPVSAFIGEKIFDRVVGYI